MEGQRIAAVPHRFEFAHIFMRVPALRISVIIIYGHAVGPGHHGHIVFRFPTAFDLQAIHANAKVIIQLGHNAQVARIKNVGAAAVFLDRHQLTGAAAFFEQKLEHVGVVLVNIERFHGAVFHPHPDLIVPAA